jgi:hypothetical protein
LEVLLSDLLSIRGKLEHLTIAILGITTIDYKQSNFSCIVINHFFLLTIPVSILVAFSYCIVGLWKKKLVTHSLTDVFTVIIATASLISGLKLMIITFYKAYVIKTDAEIEGTDLFYTIIGGLAVAWMSIAELVKRFKELE